MAGAGAWPDGKGGQNPKGTVIEETTASATRARRAAVQTNKRAETRACRNRRRYDRSKPMNRLFQGDVGSGKPSLRSRHPSSRSRTAIKAIMVPTEILAEQHAANVKRMATAPYRVEALRSLAPHASAVYADIEAGEVDLVMALTR